MAAPSKQRRMSGAGWLLLSLAFLLRLADSQEEERFDNPRSNVSSVWANNASLPTIAYSSSEFTNGEFVRPILRYSPSGHIGDTYACGFYKNTTSAGYYFAVLIVYVNGGARISMPTVSPQPVWVANRNRPVGENATLELTEQGGLVLRDENRVAVWSTDTGGKGVTYLELLASGNLVLGGLDKDYLWQSFDHPSDVLVLGQTLKAGMKLTSSVSTGDLSEGSYFMEMRNDTLEVSAQGSPPQVYWSKQANKAPTNDMTPYALFTNGSILLFVTSASVQAYSRSGSVNDSDGVVLLTAASEMQYLQLPPNGNLGRYVKVYTGERGNSRIYNSILGGTDCSIWPGSCGRYGVCNSGQCSCATSAVPGDFFVLNVPQNPASGCRPVVPLAACSSNASRDHHFFNVSAADYLPLRNARPALQNTNLNACEELCSGNCSCKMSVYWGSSCFTFDEVYTLRNATFVRPDGVFTTTPITLIKMQNQVQNKTLPGPVTLGNSKAALVVAVLLPILGAIAIVVFSIFMYSSIKRRRRELEELALDAMAGLPRRYSYRELQEATINFSTKLGQGGFGAVFLGELQQVDESNEQLLGEKKQKVPVAVKKLESANQGHREFRTEVSIIGSVQHFNLVQLKGFCAENEHRLLVYELIENGSLDRWLFKNPRNDGTFLRWDTRLKIALGTARGLAYLHEECREKIIHLDIKTQNILLDPDFNAKVCDFGLSKLMKRDESAVFTTMRGTPGYLAPEWLQSSITEKVDVYSFGVVLLELVSGEKCLDATRTTASRLHFPSWAFGRIAHGGSAMELLDKHLVSEMENKPEEVERLVNIAFLCSQEDPGVRPSMSCVVQMLEDLQLDAVESG